ncbi:MAG TPA: amino acid adenylation domain-containing protein [Candidatus Limnocylindrales bacterium]|nr:amino acid adenylation domain-containing protein [Candidatus Limnocylindrales bacterium]
MAELGSAAQAVLRQRLRRRVAASSVRPRPAEQAPPLSYAQERLWFLDQYSPGNAAYAIPLGARLRGALDGPRLRRSLERVASHHEALRMRFSLGANGNPEVIVDPEGRFPLDEASAGDEAAATVLLQAFLAEPFDLATGPVARAILVAVEDHHVLGIAVHHIAADGWSMEILLRDIMACYHGGQPAPVPVQYGDYATDQRERGPAQRDIDFWRERLAGLTPLELPTDFPRAARQTHRGTALAFTIDTEVTNELNQLARDHNATLYMVLLAAYAALLGWYAGQDEVAIGSPVAGRPAPELEPVVGCFVNMLTMRVDLAGDPSFVDALARVRDTVFDSLAHQELAFEHLVAELNVDRDVSRSPLFQVAFSMMNYGGNSTPEQAEPVIEPFPVDSRSTRYDLELYAAESHHGLAITVVYNVDLFADDRMQRFQGHLETLLSRIVARPETRLSRLDMLSPAELTQREAWNDTACDLGEPGCLHPPLLQQASQTPHATAIIHPHGRISRGELEAMAQHTAAALVEAGIHRGELVAVVMERCWEQVVAVLAIHLAGGAYLPVDADLPPRRREQLLRLGECRHALTRSTLVGQLELPPDIRPIPTPSPAQTGTQEVESHPEDLAYVIFTSGSTGTPKGVMIDHRAAVNTIRDINRRFGIGAQDRVLAVSALSFDLSVYDIFGILAAGGTLVLPEHAHARDPAAWARLVAEQRITVWDSVPALMELLVEQAEQDGTDISSLRLVMMSGDWIPLTLPDRIRRLAPQAKVVSLGGATEGAIWSILHEIDRVDRSWPSIPYGRPMANQSFYILDRHGRPVPVGIPGELHIGGAGVALGYWRQPELTDAAFGPFGPTAERLYRTGDMGQYHQDGTIEFLGRKDSQIKIRGYRIELGEIEAALARHGSIAECVVVARGPSESKHLVAYFVPRPPAEVPGAADLRAYLTGILPGYMVPSRFLALDAFPLTANGKVDRGRLPEPEPIAEAPAAADETRTATEDLVSEVWAEVLGIPVPGLDENFFDLGGHSLLGIKVVTRLRKRLPEEVTVNVVDIFQHPTVRQLSRVLNLSTSEARAERLLYELTPARSSAPELTLVCVPYGGGTAIAYQPLANALPATHALWAVELPGADSGEGGGDLSVPDLARSCVEEIRRKVPGPIAVYGHCGVGSAVAVATALLLQESGADLRAVYLGGIFPFARPRNRVVSVIAKAARLDFLRSDRDYANWLTSLGVELSDLEPGQVRRIVRNMRRDSDAAEDYFTGLFQSKVTRLRAPVIAVAGEKDPATDYYQERYREWHFLSSDCAAVVLAEAGHYFVRYRAEELAEIVTGTHERLDKPVEAQPDPAATWWLHGVSHDAATGSANPVPGPQPSLKRLAAVAAGQLVSVVGTGLTEFAIPIWAYLKTQSLLTFGVMAMLAVVPGLLVSPLAGAIVDRGDRRRVMLAGDTAAGVIQLALGVLLWTGNLQLWHIYPMLAALSIALTFQRLAYLSAVPQLVPKRFLGHAAGMLQLSGGVAQLVVPLLAVALLAAIDLDGILALDVASYAVAIAVLLLVRFPLTMAWQRKEPIIAEIKAGFRFSWGMRDAGSVGGVGNGNRGFRAMLLFFAGLNIFLSPLLLLISPLVLGFGTLDDAGMVAFVSGLGVLSGAVTMIAWGGPRRLKMRGMLWCTLVLAVFCAIAGLRPDLAVVAVGAFGMSLSLTLVNGVYTTIVQVKVPQRFHGRVFAVNTLIAWSTLPLAFTAIAPYGTKLFTRLISPGGPLEDLATVLVGAPGRGVAFLYVTFAVAIALISLAGMRIRTLARFDHEVPDALPDDLVGVQRLGVRSRLRG